MKHLLQKARPRTKKITTKWLLAKAGILSLFVGSAVGMASCYGTGVATFKTVRGKVVSKTTKVPIKNIQVSADVANVTRTDSVGDFTLGVHDYPLMYLIDFQDIDSTENGSFYSRQDTVWFSDEMMHKGKDELVDMGTIELEPKE